ncbi:MAG: hypothetical protein GY809_27740 [Planctomycetes bacterium]|nr:hypothetical protein [Planctomycetota bacterium]
MATAEDSAVAQARSVVYSLLAVACEYPSSVFAESVNSGEVKNCLQQSMCRVFPDMATSEHWSQLATDIPYTDLTVEYTRLFDVGMAGPPCPLNGGAYTQSRMGCLQDLVRFYSHFQLSVEQNTNDRKLPDHLTVQMEFLHFLCQCESEFMSSEPTAAIDYARAQTDFLTRHPCQWVPVMLDKLRLQMPLPYYLALFELLEAFAMRDLNALKQRSGAIMVQQVS